MRSLRRLALVSLLAASHAIAQPAADKDEAKRLMQTGVKLLEEKDYLGALSVFKDAYKRFASAKILLNIGTTLKLLDRKAEAATTYQRYLDSPDADPAKRTEVNDAIVDLDKSLGHVSVTVEPPDAELAVGDDWLKGSRILHLDPGTATIRVRRDGYQPGERTVTTTAGQQLAIAVSLATTGKPVAKPPAQPPPPPPRVSQPVPPSNIVVKRVPPAFHDEAATSLIPQPRSRVGAFAMGHVSVYPKVGSAVLVGATADVTRRLELDAAAILGPGLVSSMNYTLGTPPSFGVYAGGSYAFMDGKTRPRASLGLPIFFSNGARVGVRGAGGLEYVVSRNLSLIVELGVEATVNGEKDISDPAIVPALAATGRL